MAGCVRVRVDFRNETADGGATFGAATPQPGDSGTLGARKAAGPRAIHNPGVGSRGTGALVARVLEGAWRATPPPLFLTPEELERVSSLLIGSGAAALGWWRVSRSNLATSPQAARLHDSARSLAIADAIRQSSIAEIAGILNGAAVSPLVFKGWAVAREYADSFLRPFGDFDLLVRQADVEVARKVLHKHSDPLWSRPEQDDFQLHLAASRSAQTVDLHLGLHDRYHCPPETLFARGVPVHLPGGQQLILPRAEDHLRIVALHFFRHGGWRPLWLCDVAALVENAGATFDWEMCFTQDVRTAEWICAAIALAAALLGCRDDLVPAQWRKPAPAWLVASILESWRAPFAVRHHGRVASPTFAYARTKLGTLWPTDVLTAFSNGWPVERAPLFYDRLARFGTDLARTLTKLGRPWWWRNLAATTRWILAPASLVGVRAHKEGGEKPAKLNA